MMTFMLANGWMAKEMDSGGFISLMEHFMKDIGKIIKWMGKEELFISMENIMLI